jgi:hypothetical protein
MLKRIYTAAAAATAIAALHAPAVAQNQEGLVNVNLELDDVTVLDDFLNENEVEILNNVLNQNDVQVQVPIGIAANVCNVAVNVLAQGGAVGSCEAKTGSAAFANLVRRQVIRPQQ